MADNLVQPCLMAQQQEQTQVLAHLQVAVVCLVFVAQAAQAVGLTRLRHSLAVMAVFPEAVQVAAVHQSQAVHPQQVEQEAVA
jgi:hypothetical protein